MNYKKLPFTKHFEGPLKRYDFSYFKDNSDKPSLASTDS